MSKSQSRINRQRDIAPETVAPEDYLDSNEQQELIKKFVEQNESSNAWFQNIITLAAIAFAMVKLYYACSQALFPWYLLPHATFSDTVPATVISLWDFSSCFAFGLVGLAMHPAFGIHSVTIRRGMHLLAAISYLFFFSTWFLYRGFDLAPELVWFVGGNMVIQAMALYAEYLIADSYRQIQALISHQYQHKKA